MDSFLHFLETDLNRKINDPDFWNKRGLSARDQNILDLLVSSDVLTAVPNEYRVGPRFGSGYQPGGVEEDARGLPGFGVFCRILGSLKNAERVVELCLGDGVANYELCKLLKVLRNDDRAASMVRRFIGDISEYFLGRLPAMETMNVKGMPRYRKFQEMLLRMAANPNAVWTFLGRVSNDTVSALDLREFLKNDFTEGDVREFIDSMIMDDSFRGEDKIIFKGEEPVGWRPAQDYQIDLTAFPEP